MNRLWLGMAISVLLAACQTKEQEIETGKIEIKTRMDSVSYIIGLDYGQGIKEQGIDPNKKLVYKGIVDGLEGSTAIPDSIREKLVEKFNKELDEKRKKEEFEELSKNLNIGRDFLVSNKKKKGVTELESGLQYKIIKEGTGIPPNEDDSVTVHYQAMFTDRTIFDESYGRGAVGIQLSNAINGLSQGIRLMKPGAIYELYIPSNLAYGEKPFANIIPPGSTLIYRVELIDVYRGY